MEKQDIETRKEMLQRYKAIALCMTQAQIDACAWLMGTYSCGWTPTTLAAEYQDIIDKTED